jgi:hypothetical protein
MRIKSSVIEAIKLMHIPEVAEIVGCSAAVIYYQLKGGNMGANAATKYAKFLGRNVSEMFEGRSSDEFSCQPFDEWLLENFEDLPNGCFTSHGKVIVRLAKELWQADCEIMRK